MAEEPNPSPPKAESDQDSSKREYLPDLHPHVETENVRDQAVLRQVEVLKLGRKPETVEQAKDQNRKLGVGFETQEAFEPVHVVEGLVDHGEAYDRVDDVRVGVDTAQDACEQRDA